MDHLNSMETTSVINCERKQTPLTEAIEGIKLSADTDVGNPGNPLAEAVAEENISTDNSVFVPPPKPFMKTNDLLEESKDSEMDVAHKESKCQKDSVLEKMEFNQKTDVGINLVNNSSYDNKIESEGDDSVRKEIFGSLSNMTSVNDKKISFSDIKISEADKCISSRSGRVIRTRYPKQAHSDELLIKPIRGQKRKAEINVLDLYTQDKVGDVNKCTPLETISEGVEWECGMTKKRRLCQFNSPKVSYDPIPYSPSRAKVRMQKKRAKELGVTVCQGRRVSIEDVKGMLDSISGDEEEQMMEDKTG